MHKIQYSKAFLKQFKKLSPDLKRKTKEAIKRFEKNPKDLSLKAHKLTGRLDNFYSFSIDYKFRIIFEIDKQLGQIIFLKVGGHDVYR
jgi:proteic killer suppression protein